jgi:PAS domain S-box-containing protein
LINSINPALEQYMGCSACEVVGKTISEVELPAERIAFWTKQINSVFETGEAQQLEAEIGGPGAGRYFAVRLIPEHGEDGEIQSVMAISSDLIERYMMEKRLEQIYRLSNAVSRAASVQEICCEALEGMRESLGADRAAVLILDDGVMRFTHWVGLSERYRKAVEGHSPWSEDARNPQPVVVPDVETEPALEALREVILSEGIRSLAFIPLAYDGRLLGKVMLYYDTPRPLRNDVMQLAQSVASHIAFMIEHKRAEQALKESEDRYRTLVELSPEAILVHAEGRVIYANAAAARLMNADSAQALVGRPMLDWVHADDQEVIAQRTLQIDREGKARHSAEVNYRRSTGGKVTLEVSSAPVAYGGKAARLVFLRNITERKLAEQEVRESERRLDMALKNSPFMLWRQDRQLGYTWVYNPVGFTSDQVLGKTDFDLLRPEDATKLANIKQRVMQTDVGERHKAVEVAARGRKFYFDLTLNPLYDESGSIVGITGGALDVTELKQAEEWTRFLSEASAILEGVLKGRSLLSLRYE